LILPPCSGLFWSLLGSLLLIPGPSMAVGAEVGPFLGDDVFLRGVMWMGRLALAIPPASAYSSWLPNVGTRHAGEAPSDLVTTMLVGGREASRCVVIGERFYPLYTCPWNIT
jgi:hypothetical protein